MNEINELIKYARKYGKKKRKLQSLYMMKANGGEVDEKKIDEISEQMRKMRVYHPERFDIVMEIAVALRNLQELDETEVDHDGE